MNRLAVQGLLKHAGTTITFDTICKYKHGLYKFRIVGLPLCWDEAAVKHLVKCWAEKQGHEVQAVTRTSSGTSWVARVEFTVKRV